MNLPYERASQAIQKKGQQPYELAKTVGSLAVGAGSSLAALSSINRALPMLNQYLKPELISKGLSKINPRLGAFAEKAMAAGFGIEEIKDFLGEKGQELQEETQNEEKEKDIKKEDKEKTGKKNNIIYKYSPELYETIKNYLESGKTLSQAATFAYEPPYIDIAYQMMQDYNKDWKDIVKMAFGGDEKSMKEEYGNIGSNIGLGKTQKSLFSQPQQPQPNQSQMQQKQPSGNADAQLMAMLQKVSGLLGG